ncbi:MAG: DUF445 family protein [Lachnospiraceae bacterium]|nr:DUF445 family protein [Lachnospiraceae bacterium]
MTIPNYITGPVIGAIIGCFTNYIAVKMLFYPRKEIRLFGHVLPFTPGAIPKGKSRLAGSIGNAVATSLLTKKDIEDMLLSPEIENEIADVVMKHFTVGLKDEVCSLSGITDDRYEEKKAEIGALLSHQIVEAIDVPKLMEEHGTGYIKERIHSHTLGKLVSSEWIGSMAMSVANDLQDILNEKGDDYVKAIVAEKMDKIDSMSIEEMMSNAGTGSDRLRRGVTETYRAIASDNVDELLSHIDIASVISGKINDMDIDELERLILTVMKNELRTIISLGAFIGFVLGLLNCF